MATVTPQMIKELRDRTQAGMSDCKGALTEAEGDMEKAVEIILKKGLAKSAKRAGAVATEGEVRASVSPDKRAATVVEVNIQTDFVARSDQFKKFVGDVLAARRDGPRRRRPRRGPARRQDRGRTLASELTGKIGEKIDVRRWARVEVAAGKHGLAALVRRTSAARSASCSRSRPARLRRRRTPRSPSSPTTSRCRSRR
jgi:elongation factor Ts